MLLPVEAWATRLSFSKLWQTTMHCVPPKGTSAIPTLNPLSQPEVPCHQAHQSGLTL